jgi:RND family efflux transporter MFP subunit
MKHSNLISLFIFSIFLIVSCKPGAEKTSEQDDETPVLEIMIPVKVETLAMTSIARTIDYTATLLPFEEVHLAPTSPGRIDGIYVEVGDQVKKGQKLFLMDRTQLNQTILQLKSIETDLGRMGTLLETGSITQQKYDQIKTQYDITSSSVNFMTKNTSIAAPFPGVITGKYFENGEMFGGAPNTSAGKAAVVTLMQVNPVKAIVNISEQFIPLVDAGMEAILLADVYPDTEFEGKVSLVHPTVDPMARSFKIEITVPNSNSKLRPGMFVRVSMFLGEDRAFIVPANTVLQQEGTNLRYIFIEKNGIAIRHNVEIGKRYDEKVEIITDAVSEGDKLIVEGQTKLDNNDKVEVVS